MAHQGYPPAAMPTLNWIGKEAVVKHHLDVPFHLLKDVPALSCGDSGSGNLILKADNLIGLKALLPYYAGQVKCIAIDPPYNTGQENWAYNDNVNSPIMKKWLGEVVGKEGETLDRHDRWLCMMYPRLMLLRQFLREDGVIMVNIGDDSFAPLLYLLDEIFGANNRMAIFVWKSRAKPSNVGEAKVKPQRVGEYIPVYALSAKLAKFHRISSGETRTYPFTNEAGRPYRHQTILKSNRGENIRETMRFQIAGYTPPADQRWQGGKRFIQDLYDSDYIDFKEGTPFRRYYEDEEPDEHDPLYAYLPPDWTGTAETGKSDLNKIVGNMHGFDTVKPTILLKRLIEAATTDGDIVLDSFAGTGTSGHATLALNAMDGLSRRFILIEMESEIAENITAERVRRVADGYKNAKGEDIPGLGGGFRFCELGGELFDARGQIKESVRFADLARHVYFSATGEPLPKARVAKTPLLGVHHGKAVCLLYNGILKDKTPQGGNALTRETLALIKEACEGEDYIRILVFGTSKRIADARLKRENVDFQQIPYSLRTS